MATRKPARKTTRNQPQKRNLLDLQRIEPKTDPQEQMIDAYAQGFHIVGAGSAGTGKSFIALYLALKDVLAHRKQKVIILRSAVPTREIGHLPGTAEEKLAEYEAPYKQIVNDLCQCGTAYETMKQKEMIEFKGTGFLRGITIDNAVIILDEFQSMTQEEVYTVLTRVGENTQVFVIGDTRQCDLNARKEKSCFDWLMSLSKRMEDDFEVVHFYPQDIVRSDFVRRLIIANET